MCVIRPQRTALPLGAALRHCLPPGRTGPAVPYIAAGFPLFHISPLAAASASVDSSRWRLVQLSSPLRRSMSAIDRGASLSMRARRNGSGGGSCPCAVPCRRRSGSAGVGRVGGAGTERRRVVPPAAAARGLPVLPVSAGRARSGVFASMLLGIGAVHHRRNAHLQLSLCRQVGLRVY